MADKPYKYAQLYDADGDVSKGKEWYFYYYLLNPATGKFKRYFQRFNINRIKGNSDADTKKKRYVYSREIIEMINQWLDEGNYKDAVEINSDEKTLKSGILLTIRFKTNKNLKHRSVQTYQNIADRFILFLEESHKKEILLKDVSRQHIIKFRDYILMKGVSNLTANKNTGILQALF